MIAKRKRAGEGGQVAKSQGAQEKQEKAHEKRIHSVYA
jgi:hypothetical protein